MGTEKTVPFAGVIGNPITHSLSPTMHAAWLAAASLPCEYRAIEMPRNGFAKGITELARNPDFLGANITLPFKQDALAFADTQTKLARTVGAANLLVRDKDGWLADNTDVDGFLTPLQSHVITNKTALVFGAGGAARAVLVALQQAGYDKIALCNRTNERAQELLTDLNIKNACHMPFARRNQPGFVPGLLVNAGSAGMTGFAPLDVDLRGFPANMLVYDLVYAPLQTPLLAQARKAGMTTIGGLSMLIEQARPSFATLFGTEAPKTIDMPVLLQAVLEKRP